MLELHHTYQQDSCVCDFLTCSLDCFLDLFVNVVYFFQEMKEEILEKHEEERREMQFEPTVDVLEECQEVSIIEGNVQL